MMTREETMTREQLIADIEMFMADVTGPLDGASDVELAWQSMKADAALGAAVREALASWGLDAYKIRSYADVAERINSDRKGIAFYRAIADALDAEK